MIKISSEVRVSLKKRLNRINGQINGIGKNFITNKNRLHGIAIYSFFVRLFYLRVYY